ncbi:MAG: integration host factor subunit beta [Ignavibacteriae bacterium]|nr:integration host factor subunit beta [Ignavibacteriota bacterium]MCB0723267.1 integration host factor subunit beta [Ignavibacteriota bacterium]MCB9243113.1 integration host factor subunit beta [Ignavibacteriales bacterium]
MTRAQIAAKISEATGLSKKETEIVVEGFISCVIEALKENETIEIRGFGTFKNNIKEPRIARNPKTGEKIQLGKRFIPMFKVSKEFKKVVQDSLQ